MLLNKRISIIEFLQQIKLSILFLTLYAVVIGLLDNHRFFASVSIPLAISGVVGTAVSLLLAFRTSQSYERWWEARVVWGAIVNDSRTLVRQLELYLPSAQSKAIDELSERQVVWCYALGESLRRLPFSERVASYLAGHRLDGGTNIPASLLNEHSRQLKKLAEQGQISDFGLMQVDNTLMRLCESMGRCERIKNTVFPRNYSLLIHFLIYVFATILPFGLDDSNISTEIVVTALLPIIFIAIEKTAILMQDPFENLPLDTPMTALATTIETNLAHLTGKTPPVQSPQDGYFVM